MQSSSSLVSCLSTTWVCLILVSCLTTLLVGYHIPFILDAKGSVSTGVVWQPDDAQKLAREGAEKLFRAGQGHIWFHHMQKAGGTSLCEMFKKSETLDFPKHAFSCMLLRKGTTRKAPWPANQPKPKIGEGAGIHDIGYYLAEDGAEGIAKLQKDLKAQNVRSFASEGMFAPRNVLEDLALPSPGQEFDFSQYVFVTNFREPIDRIRSAINYHKMIETVVHGSLEECVSGEAPVCTHELFRNFAVRQFAGLYGYCQIPPPALDLDPFHHLRQPQQQQQHTYRGDKGALTPEFILRNPHVGSHPEAFFRAATEEDLKLAKMVLLRFSGVIIMETMKRDVCVMAKRLGVADLPDEVPRHMQHKRAAVKDAADEARAAEVRLRLEELNSLDMELYRFAVEMADERAREYPEC